ncbi:hypothetical protein U6A24_20015 [Aquimarina gracilis]|uniref:DUF2268 domain-containing protein n=1 Tax=Aquimarina gracilis TaxID=874422 RepID=A0ABU6A0Y3_9FLAO|nr:hypothetical protein [Aquimarina gracilis]MEB3347774.1 hypothetical protein [Aquimarina gracilis]
MKKYSILLVILITNSFFGYSQLSLELDLSNAQKTIEVLKNKTFSESQTITLAQLGSSKALLKKLNTKDSTMIETIKKVQSGSGSLNTIEQKFQYNAIIKDLDRLSGFIKELQSNLGIIETKLKKSLQIFIPSNKHITIKIIGIVGGNSTGYTFGDGNTFHISLHHMNNDLDYFFMICKHELFHNLQAIWSQDEKIRNTLEKTKDSSPDYWTYFLFNALYLEGSATYLDDLKTIKETKANKSWLDRYKDNEKREKFIFWMFDRLMVDFQKSHSQKNVNNFYNTFFTTNIDEIGYYLGSAITTYILKNKPKTDLITYMKASPLLLVSDYINLSKNDDTAPYQFSEEFEKIVSQLSVKVNNMSN